MNSKNPLKTTWKQILSADTYIWIITGLTNLIGLIYYCIIHPKGSYKNNEENNAENTERIDDEEEDSIPLNRKLRNKRKKKNYDKDLGESLIRRLKCLVDFYMILFGLNYSIVFSNT